MNKFLCKTFIKNWDCTDDSSVRNSYGTFTGITGIVCNIILSAIKFFAGTISGSIAIIGDAVNSLTDAFSSVLMLVGFKIASKPEDEEHPYGHERVEYVTGIIIAICIIIAGVELAQISVNKIMHPAPVETSILIYIIMIISVAIKLWQTSFCYYAANRIDSEAIKATALDNRNDIMATAAVILSMVLEDIFSIDVDGVIGTIVAIFIIISGILSCKETISPLLGEKPDEEIISSINNIVCSYSDVLGIHDLIIHNYGKGKIFASIHIEVDAAKGIVETHNLIDSIERDVAKKLKIKLTAHMDPVETCNSRSTELERKFCRLVEKIEGISDLHDFRIDEKEDKKIIRFDIIKSHSCPYTNEELTEKFTELATKESTEYLVEIDFDGGYSMLNG